MADLRSDTITRPSAAMREVIGSAEVGDDVLGDDPTVRALEAKIAEMLGKEAALFVPSGTMSNAVALRTHTQPGDEIIVDKNAHIYVYEGGGYAALCGVSIALVDGTSGQMAPEQVKSAIRKSEGSMSHYPNGSLVCMENTCNRGGGACYDQAVIDEICRIAHDADCKVHMDGARLFNAVIATGVSPSRMVRDCDTISICLSKGLGAPVGSLLVGPAETIAQGHRWRKMFGGGMRQSGHLAAAGIYALENNVERLTDDHARALRLATAVDELPGFSVNLDEVQTNMCYIQCDSPATEVVAALAERDVQLFDTDPNTVRAVTHLDVDDADIDHAIAAFTAISG
ncbi:MAG: low-specificity L-threonine aldolase [Methanobacteriota archaeon]|nr:MAG: low-specificity L-threonine aldolase [Euryarchaeota archaeon]